MELRVKIDDTFINDLRDKLKGSLGEVNGTRVTQDALALYRWAVEQAAEGRVIASSDPQGNNVQRIVMPGLNVTTTPSSG